MDFDDSHEIDEDTDAEIDSSEVSEIDYEDFEDDGPINPDFPNNEDLDITEIKKNCNNDESDSEEENVIDLEDIEDIPSEDQNNINIDNNFIDNNFINNELKEIMKAKKENIKNVPPITVINLLSVIVEYIKKNGKLLDGRTSYNYPDVTEESIAIESIILDTHPFELVINKHQININKDHLYVSLKNCLRCASSDNKIFFPKEFTEKWIEFVSNLFNDSISEKEKEEIKKYKELINIK